MRERGLAPRRQQPGLADPVVGLDPVAHPAKPMGVIRDGRGIPFGDLRVTGDAVLVQPADVRVAPQEPQQFAEDAARVQLLRGEQREPRPQVEPRLVPEDTQRARAGAVGLLGALGEDAAQERAVDVQITRLRRKIEEDPKAPRYLQTVRGAGYMLAPD